MKAIALDNRLQRVSQLIQEYSSKPIFLADIGSDHAYLPIQIVNNEPSSRAIAGEVVQGPYKNSKAAVRNAQLDQQVEVRLGNGLEVLTAKDTVTAISICGMGGQLIREILTNAPLAIPDEAILVLQPNLAGDQVRRWLMEHSYQIIDEDLVQEGKHYYEIIVSKKSPHLLKLTEEELLMGPILIKEKSTTFQAKWIAELEHYQRILKQMEANQLAESEKKTWIKKRSQLIRQVLEEEARHDSIK